MVAIPYQTETHTTRPATLLGAWITTLLVSPLPNILWDAVAGPVPGWLFWAKLAFLAGVLIFAAFSASIQSLRFYIAILLVLYLAEWRLAWVSGTTLWHGWFAGASWSSQMLGVQTSRFLVSLILVAVLLIIYRRREGFFLTRGRLDAPAAPIRWLLDKPTPWTRFGIVLTLCISLGTLLFLVIAGRPSLSIFGQALPLLPAILIFAAMNAWSEELSYRAALLAPLHDVVGKQQALLLTAAFFGIGHYNGVPYGITGVIMASVLGWLLGKSMLETRGFWWAWFIHFWQDVIIFTFLAAGSIVVGGG